MMYIRLLAIIFVFDRSLASQLFAPFLIAIVLSLITISGLLILKKQSPQLQEASEVKHPLELTTAILFATLFMLFAFLTNYVTHQYGSHGLNFLAIIVGFTDIDPFILSLLSGKFAVTDSAIVSAIILASGSNNLLKSAYAVALARNRSVLFAVIWLSILFVTSFLYVYQLIKLT